MGGSRGSWVLGIGYWVSGTGYWTLGAEDWILDIGYSLLDGDDACFIVLSAILP